MQRLVMTGRVSKTKFSLGRQTNLNFDNAAVMPDNAAVMPDNAAVMPDNAAVMPKSGSYISYILT